MNEPMPIGAKLGTFSFSGVLPLGGEEIPIRGTITIERADDLPNLPDAGLQMDIDKSDPGDPGDPGDGDDGDGDSGDDGDDGDSGDDGDDDGGDGTLTLTIGDPTQTYDPARQIIAPGYGNGEADSPFIAEGVSVDDVDEGFLFSPNPPNTRVEITETNGQYTVRPVP